MSVESMVMSSPFLIYIFSFHWSVWLQIYQIYWYFPRNSFWFSGFSFHFLSCMLWIFVSLLFIPVCLGSLFPNVLRGRLAHWFETFLLSINTWSYTFSPKPSFSYIAQILLGCIVIFIQFKTFSNILCEFLLKFWVI